MANAKSNQVVVFPAALRTYVSSSDVKTGAKFTTENNISGILRSVTDNDSYLIQPRVAADSYPTLEFVLHGYYFKVDTTDITISNNLWAGIKLDASGRLVALNGSPELDADENFMGLEFKDSATFNPAASYTLQLFKDGSPCIESLVKINSDSLGYDGGNIKDNLDALNDSNDTLNNRFDSNGILKTENGGTGKNNPDSDSNAANIWVKYAVNAQKLIGNNDIPYTVGAENQIVYFDGGIPKAGITIYKGTSAPTASTPGADGDIYIVYQS